MSAVLSLVAPSPWRRALVTLGVVWLVLVCLYADTVLAMVSIWNGSETFAHAFLVPPIALWLVWRQREVLAELTPRPEPLVLLPLTFFAAMWLVSDLVLVNAGAQFAWTALLVLSVPAVLGFEVALVILFPLLFLFFSVPIGEFMREPMMLWTADFTVAALRMSGIPVYREGLQFVIPSGSWSVVEACSGVRYLIASFMVGTLFAYLNYRSWRRRALFIAVAIVVPIVANWLRAYMIVMLGHLSNNTLAVGVDHLLYGWVFFGVVVMLMFFIGARWAEPDLPVGHTHRSGKALGAPGTEPVAGLRWVVAAVASSAVLLLPHLAQATLYKMEQGVQLPRLVLPEQLAGSWLATANAGSAGAVFEPHFENPALVVLRSYAGPQGSVQVYIAYYRGQAADSKLVSSVNALARADDSHWNQVTTGVARSGSSGAEDVHWRTARILGKGSSNSRRPELTAWRVYWVDGRWIPGDIRAKLAGVMQRLQGRGDDGAVLVLSTDNPSQAAADALLQQFTRDNLPALQTLLHETQSRR